METHQGEGGAKTDPGDSFRLLLPSEQQLACVCALFGGAGAEALVENLSAARAPRIREAVRSLMALDRVHRLKVFARALGRAHGGWRTDERTAKEASKAHPALKVYAVRSRGSR